MDKIFLYLCLSVFSFVVIFSVHNEDLTQANILREKVKESSSDNIIDYSESLNFDRINQWYEKQISMPKFDDTLQIYAAGDIMLGRYVRTLMDKNGMDYPFLNIDNFQQRIFSEVDEVHANLEGPIWGLGKKGGTSMNFAFNEDVVQYLKEYGFTLVSLANNHAYDQRTVGYENTIEKLEMGGMNWCGDAKSTDESAVYIKEMRSFKYAFLCFEDVNTPLDVEAANALISKYDSLVDFVIISIHWGAEYEHTARAYIQDYAHSFIDSGADFIIGHHPHVVQNFEIYNDRFIFYSLGNYIFDQYWANKVQEGISLKIEMWQELDEIRSRVEIFPLKSEMSQIRLMSDDEKNEWMGRFIDYGDYSEEEKKQIMQLILEI